MQQRKQQQQQPFDTLNHPEIIGGPTCRRLSLDPYAAAAMRSSTGGGAAAQQQQQQSAKVWSSTATVTGASAVNKGGAAAALPADDYIEVNPLRRMSLPMQGQAARPANELRRGSMPWAMAPEQPGAVAAN